MGTDGRIVRVLAFDPGPTHTGYAIAESGRDRQGLARFVTGGTLDSDDSHQFSLLLSLAEGGIVAVETPKGYVHEHARGAQLLETRGVATELATSARFFGYPVAELTAGQVRRALCGKANADDATVKRAVQLYTVNLPTRTNEHLRDALALSIVVLWNPKLARGKR